MHAYIHDDRDLSHGPETFDEVEMQCLIVSLLSDPETRMEGAALALGHPIDLSQIEHDILGPLLASPMQPERLYGCLLFYRGIESAIAETQ